MATPAALIRPVHRPQEPETHGPYIGVVDTIDPAETDPRRAHRLINVYPQDPVLGEGVVGRPGFEPLGNQAETFIQRQFQFTKLDGTEITGRIVSGEIQVLEWLLSNVATNGLILPGTSGNYASTPDSVPLSVTSDIDLRIHLSLKNWHADQSALIAKWVLPSQRSYEFGINNGFPFFSWTTDGSSVASLAGNRIDHIANEPLWLRVTFDVDNGMGGHTANFYISDDNILANFELVDSVTGSGTTSIFDSTSALEIGARDGGTGTPLTGAVLHAQVWDGIEGSGGTLEFDADFSAEAPGTTSFAEDANAATVTINQSGTPQAEIVAPWTTVVDDADMATAGVSLAFGVRVYTVVFADLLVISDGVNKPITWDGTAGSAGIAGIANAAGSWYGQPTVYYAKLFGILAGERNAFEWSEENDPFTGYQAEGFNNSWTLGQTDQEALYAMRGTNAALYYWRAFSTGAIRGAANPDFRTTGVHESVSPTLGCSSPDGIVQAGDSFWLVDSSGKPQRLVIDAEAYVGEVAGVPLWKGSEEETREVINPIFLRFAASGHDRSTDLVLLGIATSDVGNELQPNGTHIFTFSVRNGEFSGVWTSENSTTENRWFLTLDEVKDNLMRPVFVHSGTNGAGGLNGDTYRHGGPDGELWSDEHRAVTSGIEHIVEGLPFFSSDSLEMRFVRLDVEFASPTIMQDVEASYTTPYGPSTPLAQTIALDHTHASWGLGGLGRFMLPRVRHQVLTERFGLERWSVLAHVVGTAPAAR